MKLLLATTNKGKIKELSDLLADLPIEICSADDFGSIIEPEETGDTFRANANLKAGYYAQKSGIWAVADDSGLEVDALNGAPGVFSARFGGPGATNQEKNSKLLADLKQSGSTNRKAQFVCAVAVSDQNGTILFEAEGICPGAIAESPSGSNGFGYDPIFVPDGYSQTFGELSDSIKRQISHRSRAIAKIIEFLRGIDHF